MALIHSLENSGNFLFRHRGQMPVVLFVLAIPFIYFADYTWMTSEWYYILTSIAILLSVLGQFIRAYTIGTTPKNTSGRNRDKQVAEVLNTTGIYSMVRHPLYLGNYFMWVGIVFYTFNWYFVIIMSLLYWIYYERIMFAEERFLERKFGQDYLDWSLKAPAFWPAFSKYVKTNIPFSMKTVFRREYSGVLATVVGFVFVDVVRIYSLTGTVKLSITHYIVLGVTAAITLTLRSLKHYTRVLNEDDRS